MTNQRRHLHPDAGICEAIAARHPKPLVFATVSGAHLYGFPSADSDYDVRGVHLMSLHEALSMKEATGTIESAGVEHGVEIDLVTHEVRKFMGLMLRPNGYVLEQLLSPIVIRTTPEHEELRALAPACITRFHANHYLGFARNQYDLFSREDPPRVKPLLYVFRVLLTGIELMRTGVIEANIVRLNDSHGLSYLDDLIARKIDGAEKSRLSMGDLEFYTREYERLSALLVEEAGRTHLPEKATAHDALNDLLLRLRLASGAK